MDNNIIVLYENKKLIIQTANIILSGKLTVVDYNHPENILFTHEILNTDFLRIAAELPNGKLQVQIITQKKIMTKNITVNQR